MKKTPLHAVYSSYPGVKLIDFGGWELPVNFEAGILAEHKQVREQVGLFDVSHMGEFLVDGPGSDEFVDYLVTGNVAAMQDGQVLYALMCYPSGGVVDDLIIYKKAADAYLLVVNAANIEKDYAWVTRENPRSAAGDKNLPRIIDASQDFVQIALQGPLAEDVLATLWTGCSDLEFFHFEESVSLGGLTALISRTGYTGEDGFELYLPAKDGPALWNLLMEAGEPFGILPCGLGARDTLRLESKLPLYGHELTSEITPLEANLSVFVHLDAGDFCGKDALVKQKEEGIPRSLRGIMMEDKGIPRNGYEVYSGDDCIGFVTSGAVSPKLDAFIGLVLIRRGCGLKIGDRVDIDIRGKRKRARLVKTPFYKNTGRKR
jgi:aminomethyltransferase